MRVLCLDNEQMGLDLCLRCVEDGHEVRWLRGGKECRIGEGFPGIKIITEWESSMGWAKDGLILTTGNAKWLKQLDRYRDLGFKIFSPTVRSAALEIDRQKGLEAMEAVGIDVPPFQQFPTLAAAEAFARKADKAYVFKTLGSEEDKSLSYVSSDPADLVGWLRRQQALGLTLKGPCMLQEKIDMLAELGVSGWFGPEGFLEGKWQVCFEGKKLMPGNFGPNTGEMHTVCQYVETDKLADEMLKPMEATLLKAGHRGDFAIGCGIDAKGKAWPFEFTARLGWPAFFIQVASHKGDVAQWMRDLLDGKDSLKVSRDVAIGVVLAQPRWPYGDTPPELACGNPISGAEDVWEDLHPAQMMVGKGPVMEVGKVVDQETYQTSGDLVAVATGLGKTVSKAREAAEKVIDQVCFPNMIVRNDFGLGQEQQLPKLHDFGYALDMEF